MAVDTDLSMCSRSVLIMITFRVTKRHPVNKNYLNTSAYRFTRALEIGLAVLESK